MKRPAGSVEQEEEDEESDEDSDDDDSEESSEEETDSSSEESISEDEMTPRERALARITVCLQQPFLPLSC